MVAMFKKKNEGSEITNVVIDLPIDTLDTIISYLFTDNPNITRKSLASVKKLFNILDTRIFETDEQLMARIHFIKKVLDCRLVLGVHDNSLVIEHTRGGIYDDEIVNSIIPFLNNGGELNTDETKYVNNFVSERLKYAFLFAYKDELIDELERLQIGDYESISEINYQMEGTIQKISTAMRKAKVEDDNSAYFDLSTDNMKNMLTDIVNDLRKPTNYLKTGLQYLNEMLVGGFEAGRCYLFLGVSGGFKSGMLLSVVNWIRKYNINVPTKDPDKKPTVLYITQENSLKETVERLFNISVSGLDIRNFTPDEVIDMFMNGGMTLEVNNVNMRLVYKPNKSISTDDIYDIIDEIEESGEEVIALVHDYVKRIRPATPSKELRLELANIVDEFTVIAKTRNIPVITASQLNREAVKIIEQALESGQTDIAKKLGSSNVGESWGMIENTDWAGIINREYKATTNTWYLSIRQVKSRAKNPTLTYFAHPFDEENGMRLIDDMDLKNPVSVKEIADDVLTTNNGLGSKGRKSARSRRNIEDGDEVEPIKTISIGGDDDDFPE